MIHDITQQSLSVSLFSGAFVPVGKGEGEFNETAVVSKGVSYRKCQILST